MGNGIKISKEIFQESTSEIQREALFDGIIALHDKLDDICKKRIVPLERRKLKDTGIASLFGFVGGFTAVMFKKIFP